MAFSTNRPFDSVHSGQKGSFAYFMTSSLLVPLTPSTVTYFSFLNLQNSFLPHGAYTGSSLSVEHFPPQSLCVDVHSDVICVKWCLAVLFKTSPSGYSFFSSYLILFCLFLFPF